MAFPLCLEETSKLTAYYLAVLGDAAIGMAWEMLESHGLYLPLEFQISLLLGYGFALA